MLYYSYVLVLIVFVFTDLHLSGFVLEDAEQQAVLCVSGFLPEKTDQSGADKGRDSHQSVRPVEIIGVSAEKLTHFSLTCK